VLLSPKNSLSFALFLIILKGCCGPALGKKLPNFPASQHLKKGFSFSEILFLWVSHVPNFLKHERKFLNIRKGVSQPPNFSASQLPSRITQ
jgi:hypothetical protein